MERDANNSPESLERRAFLKRALQIGAVTTGALAAGVSLAGCNSVTKRSTTITSPRPPTMADWRRLGASLKGSLVLPSSPSYATDRLLYNSKFTTLHPDAIAYVANSDDVARCVDFVTRHDIEVAARSGGHSYGGYSNCDGLVIDVSRLNTIRVNTRSNVAKVGAGARLIDVYNAVGSRDRLLPAGSCPTVGVAGLALGGGIGVFGRKFGLTCDNLRSLKLVTASGERLHVDASNHADLLWASQGGGGGNFGVATALEFDVHPMPDVALFTLQYPWKAAATVLEAWQHWVSAMPDELWSNCQLLSQGSYGFLVQTSGVFCGAPAALASLLSQLRSSIGATPSSSFVGSNDYIEAMKIEAGCSGLSIAACHLPSDNSHGVLSREAYSAKSSYLDVTSTSAQAASLVHAVEVLKDYAPTLGGGLALDAYGGAINRVAKDQTAFVHRDKLACIQATYSWSTYTSTSEVAAGQRWLTWLARDVFSPQTGAYQNYIDPTLTNWASEYYGTNLDRLEKVKKTYDPDNVFNFAQSIPIRR